MNNVLDTLLAHDPKRLEFWKLAAGETPVDLWARNVLDAAAQSVNLQARIRARIERHERETGEVIGGD